MGKVLNLAVLGGDGIGPEVVDEALKVLKALSQRFDFSFNAEKALVGASAVDDKQEPLPESTLKLCLEADAILFGAVGDPRYGDLPPDQLPERALLQLRKGLNLFANLRPIKPFKALLSRSSLKEEVIQNVDILIVRELVSGIYFGEPRGYGQNEGDDFAYNTMHYSEKEVEQIMRIAFEAAIKRKKRVCSADKANALEVMQFWRNIAKKIHEDYSEVELSHQYVDNCAMQLVANPGQFDVIVAGNMFGDILSDIGAQITGSLGMLPSASLGKKTGLFEPVHGSAPDIAGKGIANPLAAILSLGLLLRYAKNWKEEAFALEEAVESALSQGYLTQDLMQGMSQETGAKILSTQEMGDTVAAIILER